MLSRTVVPFLLLALLVLAANAIADENDESIHAIWHLSPTRLGSLPPFLAGEIGFQDSSTKPVEAQLRFQFADRSIKLKSSYQERNLLVDPLIGENRKRPIFSLFGTSDIVGNLLRSETEFAYNALDARTAESLGRETARMFRVGLKGDWHGHKYGGEYRTLDKGFVHFKGGEAERGEDLTQIWGETGFGPLRLRATFAQLWENINESQDMPRITRSSALLLNYKKGDLETVLSSAYSRRVDGFHDGSVADMLSYELRTTYQPINNLKITPMIRYAGDWNRTSGIRSETPSASLTLTYSSWRNILNFVSSATYHGSRSSDRLSHLRDFGSVTKITWNFGNTFEGRKTLTYEFSYNNHRDLVLSGNSKNAFSTKVFLSVHRF
ncbi:MAG TPA: hypothetical protein VJ646_21340 [Candidatus Binatia bacterium]|nr:hypothetical protein [Candidatus Binatia bacterium]